MARKKGGAAADPRWRSHLEPAPGDLRIVQAWLNTDGAGGRDTLATVAALDDWLRLWGLLDRGAKLGPADLERVVVVRSGLRAMVSAHHGPRPAPDAARRLEHATATAKVRVRFGQDGSPRFEPDAEGLDGALARLLAIAAMAEHTGDWRRLKLCTHKECRAAFFDFSNGLTAKWCSSRCGGKLHSSTYRRRRRHYLARKRRDSSAAP